MADDEIPRKRPERTGKHLCAACLREVSAEEYFGGDFYCEACAEKLDAHPFASTPAPRRKRERK